MLAGDEGDLQKTVNAFGLLISSIIGLVSKPYQTSKYIKLPSNKKAVGKAVALFYSLLYSKYEFPQCIRGVGSHIPIKDA